MQLRTVDISGAPDLGDKIALLNLRAWFNEKFRGMRISRYPAAGMANKQKIAITAQLIAGINHHAIFGSANGAPSRAAILIPSLCNPPSFGPKLEIMAPFTGNKNRPTRYGADGIFDGLVAGREVCTTAGCAGFKPGICKRCPTLMVNGLLKPLSLDSVATSVL